MMIRRIVAVDVSNACPTADELETAIEDRVARLAKDTGIDNWTPLQISQTNWPTVYAVVIVEGYQREDHGDANLSIDDLPF